MKIELVNKITIQKCRICKKWDQELLMGLIRYVFTSYSQVAWYRIFVRNATGSNVKARLNDYHFPGTGEQVPYHHHELRVSGLKANEKYVIAVAAYTADGKLIGDSVGDSTKPILANHPLPVLTTWAFLTQVGGSWVNTLRSKEKKSVLPPCACTMWR